MYNRYIPGPEEYAPIPEEHPPRAAKQPLIPEKLAGFLEKWKGEKPDSGDILLLLIVLLLWHEEGDRDLLIALGAALLLGDQGL